MDNGKKQAWSRWCEAREKELSGPNSWIGLIGLDWLEPGVNRVGGAQDCVVRLPGGEAHLGDLVWSGDALYWQPLKGDVQELVTDRDGAPTVVDCAPFAFFVVERDGRLAARVRNREWAKTQPFAGLQYFDYDPAWAIVADWLALEPPVVMEVPNVTGDLKPVTVAHKAVFAVAGAQVELLPMSVSEREVFFVFRDRTSGRDSYGAGRFLKAKPAQDGRIRLDFNFAFSPPCAFTAFATCPLPPPENWLPFSVMAGEKKWLGQ
ncbi:MAG: hypothetical protein H6R16_1874 [Proteobacteria bacterium]|nr:hypothetical protein [Pseudomonadota bacterium]